MIGLRSIWECAADRGTGNDTMRLNELVETIAKTLVNDPAAVEVREIEGALSSMIEVRVSPTDLGMVIGKRGRTADALRTITSAVAAKLRKRAVLDIIE